MELNGTRVNLNGGCVHHDNGALGAMAFDRAEERKVELLKQAGFNAIRTSHNPPSRRFSTPATASACSSSMRPSTAGNRARSRMDYTVSFKEWWQRDIDAMMLRDRNHPSVVMWSIGNEIPGAGGPMGARVGPELAARVRTLDDRPITVALETWNLANRSWDSVNPVFDKLDVAGINYTQNIYPDQHARFPTRVILSTETYPKDAFIHWSLSQDNPYVIGEFVWTAMDYLGESGIGRNYPPGQAPSTTPTAASFPITPPTAATSISPASASRFRTTATSSGTTAKNSTSPCRNPVPTVDPGSAPNGLSRPCAKAGPGRARRGRRCRWKLIRAIRACSCISMTT